MDGSVEAGVLLSKEDSGDEDAAPVSQHARGVAARFRALPKALMPLVAAGGLVAGTLLLMEKSRHAAVGRQHRSDQLLRSGALVAAEEKQEHGGCGKVDEDVDYIFQGQWYKHMDHIGDQETCCDLCGKEGDRCRAWTWVRDANLPTGNPGQCWLKGGFMKGKQDKKGVVSGKNPGNLAELEEEDEDLCSQTGQSCLKSTCCKDPGFQCYTKDQYWGQCMASCEPGPNPKDQTSNLPWECKPLGERTPGAAAECAQPGEDCRSSKCCALGGTLCYEKNATWAQCKIECTTGVDLTADDWQHWSCKELGDRSQKAAPWTKTQCAQPGANCLQSSCCATPGHQCFRQSQYWGECNSTCAAGQSSYPGGPEWDCTPLGSRTPEDAREETTKIVGKWVPDRCTGPGQDDWDDCTESHCCFAVGKQCFRKDEKHAECKESCSTEPDPKHNNETWDCEKLGPKSWGLSLKGYPSLFCVSLYMPEHYEGPLLKVHLEKNAGIFACDGYDVFAATPDTLGTSKDGRKVEALLIPKITVGISQDGTAGNAKLFMALWDKVISTGRFRNFDFTIKVDPDAVIVAPRIRTHMEAHVGKKAYVVNCNKFPGSPNFPMMYGAVEIFTHEAMIAYAYGSWQCGQQLPWHQWGEDYYMTHCLDFLGVGRIDDFGSLGDHLCTGANCKDTYTASFHPFKDIESWTKCWDDTTAA